VDPIAAVRTVACIPLYAGVAPLGSLVLVAVAPRSFGERDVRSLERPLRELTRIIEAVRRRAGGDEENPVVPLPRVASPAVAGERAGGTRSEIADRQARAEAERAVSMARAELEVARQAAASGAADAAAILGERHAEVERLVARLTRAEAEAARERDLSRERDR